MSHSIAGTRAPTATPVRTAQPQVGRPQPSPDDVTAMTDAFAAVRKREAATPARMPMPMPKDGAGAEPPPAQARAMVERWHDRSAQERESADQPLHSGGGLIPGAAPLTVQVPAMPPPAVDPSGFVQLMAQLWARENGKGAKDVRVQFGASAWPATGARLVRNAAGMLDIELQLGDRHPADDRMLDLLRDGFEDSGLAIGALTAGADPIA